MSTFDQEKTQELLADLLRVAKEAERLLNPLVSTGEASLDAPTGESDSCPEQHPGKVDGEHDWVPYYGRAPKHPDESVLPTEYVCGCGARKPYISLLDERRAAHDAESPIPGHPGSSDREAITNFLTAMGLPTDKNYLIHFQAFVQAQRIYVNRYPTYMDEPIKKMGLKGVLVQARTCVERIWTKVFISHTHTKGALPKLDDAYDGINYLAHFITQSLLRNNGDWDWGDDVR